MLFTAWGRLYTGADFTASHCGNIYLQALSIATNKLWLHHVMVMSQSHSSDWVSLNQLMVDIEWFKWFKSTIINYWLHINLFGYALRCLLLSQCPVAQEPGMRCHSTLSERGLGGASHKNLGGAVQWNTLDLVLILSRMSQYVSICDNALPWQW